MSDRIKPNPVDYYGKRKSKVRLDVERVILEHIENPRVLKRDCAESMARDVMHVIEGRLYWHGGWRKRRAAGAKRRAK